MIGIRILKLSIVFVMQGITTDLDIAKENNGYSLHQNFQNPVQGKTNIAFGIPNAAYVSLKVFNMQGMEVAELAGKQISAGMHTLELNTEDLSSGIYFYTLNAGEFSATRKMMIGQ